jgi:hypothetical protein
MKSLLRKSASCLGAMLAACAFVVPSMASAASWSLIGTTHQLVSNNLAFSAPLGGGLTIGSSCAAAQFDANVVSASTLQITGAKFTGCTATGLAAGCTMTATGTRFPWTATATTTNNIQILGIHVDVRSETAPSGFACNVLVHNRNYTYTGNLNGGSWDPSAIGVNRTITFNNASGTILHSGIGALLVTLNGSFRDPTGTLNLLD